MAAAIAVPMSTPTGPPQPLPEGGFVVGVAEADGVAINVGTDVGMLVGRIVGAGWTVTVAGTGVSGTGILVRVAMGGTTVGMRLGEVVGIGVHVGVLVGVPGVPAGVGVFGARY